MDNRLNDLEASVDPKVGTPDWRAIFRRLQQMSQEARLDNPPETYSYGQGPRDLLDLHRKGLAPGAPALVFFHGGGWTIGSKEDMTFVAPALNECGIAYIAPNYPLAPASSMAATLPACRDVVAWVYRNADELGIDRDRIYLGGASAGAHIAAYLLTLDWSEYGLPDDAFKGGILLNGYYDLRPMKILPSYSYLGLTDTDVMAFSPIQHVDRLRAPILVAWAEKDPSAIREQSQAFLYKAQAHRFPAGSLVQMGSNHFDFALSLADASSRLMKKIAGVISQPDFTGPLRLPAAPLLKRAIASER